MSRSVRFPIQKKAQPYTRDADQKVIVAFTIKETAGPDEQYAAQRADAKNSKSTNEELIRYSIVSYERLEDDGATKIVECNKGTPFESFDKWSTKARNFVAIAWRSINAVNDEEADDFLSEARDVE